MPVVKLQVTLGSSLAVFVADDSKFVAASDQSGHAFVWKAKSLLFANSVPSEGNVLAIAFRLVTYKVAGAVGDSVHWQ